MVSCILHTCCMLVLYSNKSTMDSMHYSAACHLSLHISGKLNLKCYIWDIFIKMFQPSLILLSNQVKSVILHHDWGISGSNCEISCTACLYELTEIELWDLLYCMSFHINWDRIMISFVLHVPLSLHINWDIFFRSLVLHAACPLHMNWDIIVRSLVLHTCILNWVRSVLHVPILQWR